MSDKSGRMWEEHGDCEKIGFRALGCDVEAWNSFLISEIQPPPTEGSVNTSSCICCHFLPNLTGVTMLSAHRF
jgi:hypothetical protein